MISIIIALLAGGIAGWFSTEAWGIGWGIACGIPAGLACLAVISLLLRKKINARQMAVQQIMQNAQEQINRKLTMLQRRGSDPSSARAMMEKIQLDAVRHALAEADGFQTYYKWNILLEKQINTLRVQLYYQLKEYKKVDELLKKSLLLDPQSVAIALARMYRNNDQKIDAFFRKKSLRFKGESAAFVASVYAWIKLRGNDTGAALEALRQASRTSDLPSLKENIDRLVNGKVKHFSNSAFGDLWYALALEEPKIKVQRQQGYGRPF